MSDSTFGNSLPNLFFGQVTHDKLGPPVRGGCSADFNLLQKTWRLLIFSEEVSSNLENIFSQEMGLATHTHRFRKCQGRNFLFNLLGRSNRVIFTSKNQQKNIHI